MQRIHARQRTVYHGGGVAVHAVLSVVDAVVVPSRQRDPARSMR